eukprot:3077044-Amphidinium_carterae.1
MVHYVRVFTPKVVIIAAATATWCTCLFISNVFRGKPNDTGTALPSLFVQLSTPMCGYYGVPRHQHPPNARLARSRSYSSKVC